MTEMTGECMAAMADRWVAANPDAWDRISSMALGYEARGRRFSMEKLLQAARYDMATNGHSQGFKANNNARAALARRLMRENPGLERYMDVRRSKVDGLS